MKRILLTGGHAGTTGLVVIEELKKRNLQIDLSWIGAREGIEQKIYPKYGVNLYSIDGGKIQTKFTKDTITEILKIPIGFIKSFITTLKINPDLIISFGGSISFPVVFAGYLKNIPVILHEQTSVIGRANFWSAKFAGVVAISRESSKKYFNNKNVVLTGNPINSKISNYINNNEKNVKTILFTGGSRGSTWINNALLPILPKLLDKYKIIWQVGSENISKINYQDPNLTIIGQVIPDEMVKYMSKADLVVARAGANTVSELIALKKPSILIPIPWVYLNEQYENAKYMENLGIGKILLQKDLSPESLFMELNNMTANYENIIQKSSSITSIDLTASKKLTDIILAKLYEKSNK